MQYADYRGSHDLFAIDAAASERAAFIRRTYSHLGAAVLGFVGLEYLFLNTDLIMGPMLALIGRAWWAVFIGFMVVGWVAEKWAQSDTSVGLQYLGLSLYTLAEAVLFAPLLWYAGRFGGPDVIPTAGILTVVLFGGLTVTVFVTGADFSFLKTGLCVAGLAATGLILCSALMGFSLGLLFSAAMVVLACGCVL